MNLFSFEGILYDLPNYMFCIVFILVLSIIFRPPIYMTCLLVLSCFVPFFLNDVLFPTEYMPDQFRYFDMVRSVRHMDLYNVDHSANVRFASWFISLIPLPFVETVRAIGFFSKFLYLCLVFFLYTRGVLNLCTLVFLMLYPSLVLYTSLALRDGLIFFFMMFGFYFLVQGRFWLSLIISLPLFFIKFQNFFIQLVFIFMYFGFDVRRSGLSLQRVVLMFLAAGCFLVLLAPYLLPYVNKYRVAMWREDGGDVSDIMEISSALDFLITGLSGGFSFLVKPYPWQTTNAVQLIQSVENVVLLMFVAWLTLRCFCYDRRRTVFWIIYLFSAAAIYGIVVSNYGAAARYRFPFVVSYVVFVVYDVFYSKFSRVSNVSDELRFFWRRSWHFERFC
ncbi:MAG: hypothetical protein A2W44_12420 [Acinetobacter sp. RIFCSPHIGHO2_12_41_5]|nr:MAG: hypothetical protein A2W44_12420 [Acinetobacter sp. RIFCSPHIGHO2_12_41_5]